MTKRIAAIALALGTPPLAAQTRTSPPPDNPIMNFILPIKDFLTGYERHTTCYDYCAGTQARSTCTTRVVKNAPVDVTGANGQVVQIYTRDLPYPQNPNFKCDYPEGNPGGVGSQVMSAVPSYQDGIPRPVQPEVKAAAPRDVADNVPGPFLNVPFPPVYLSNTAPTPSGCTPQTGRDSFFLNHDLNTVIRATACGGGMVATIPVCSLPLKLAFTPDNSTMLVTCYDTAVAFVDIATNKVVFTLQTPGNVHPSGLAITPDGAKAYITNYFDQQPSVLVIDIAQRQITATIPVTTFPQSVYLTPDGAQAWVTFPFQNLIYIIDTLTNTVARTLGIASPYGLAFNSTGTKVYVANSVAPGTVSVVDTSTLAVTGSYQTGDGPVDVSVSNDDQWLFVTNNLGGSLTIIDLANNVSQTIPVGAYPRGLAQVQ